MYSSTKELLGKPESFQRVIGKLVIRYSHFKKHYLPLKNTTAAAIKDGRCGIISAF